MTRKPLKWLAPIAVVAVYAVVKLSFLPDADKTALREAMADQLDKVAGVVADNTGLGDPSQGTVTAVLKTYIDKLDPENWCLNPMKIKSLKTDRPIGLEALGNLVQSNGQNGGSFSANIFPVVFAEEAFMKWNEQDAYVMAILIGGKYIAVHAGGYPRSTRAPGNPGGVYDANNYDQVIQVINAIKSQGAVVDLTDKGRKDGVWEPDNGFCLQGFWQLQEVTGWTSPAADNEGKIVTHIK